jgi:hypothetical protein
MTHEEAVRDCERRAAEAKDQLHEYLPKEVKPGIWVVTSRLRVDWRRFSTSNRLDRPVRKGERFVTRDDMKVRVITYWRAAFTGGHDAALPAGTVLVAKRDQQPYVPGFNCVPEEYRRLETTLVPEEDRLHAKYGGYSLTFVLDDIGTKIESLE